MASLISTSIRLLAAIRSALGTPEFRNVLILVVLMLATGTIFYSSTEDWAALDALYFSVMTLTTVGSGSLQPVTVLGRVFTMVYAVAGIGLVAILMLELARASLPSGKRKRRQEDQMATSRTASQSPGAAVT